ncbi:efflux ABC transporter, permease protein [Gleimia coleocanis DSM 15436]|uniref:Efflux ABC transporter, permease protein n=1 Tax=Gleimia coleocanis DSM 15436 TaxID=525245 RepID=C0VZR2_9ACTO|nr:FtsX-like permease family protein [Gleimia coleocanis]EEH63771.1 efflux ABC transporter, permease protein [Gleimia coleocanis DSM 15436]
MKPKELLREIAISTLVMRTSSILILGITLLVTIASLITVGRAAAANATIEQRLQASAARTILVTDKQQFQYLAPQVIEAISSFSNVQRVYGTGILKDGVNLSIGIDGETTTTVRVNADFAEEFELISGRWPRVGEALITKEGLADLHLDAATGAVLIPLDKTEAPLVGVYRPKADEEVIAEVVIKTPENEAMQVARVITTDFRENPEVINLIRLTLGVHAPENINIQPPVTLAELTQSIAEDIRQYNASVLYSVLAFGALISALIVFADALAKRADLGRRLALGATRQVIVFYTIGRVVAPTILGIFIGVLGGYILTSYWGQVPPVSFTLALVYLVLLTMVLASLPGAVWASRQDPVRILRLP